MPVKVLIAENDTQLAYSLAAKFAREYFQKIDLSVITEEKAVHELAEDSRNKEILIYNPDFLTPEKERISASEWFSLTDNLYGQKDGRREKRISRSRNSGEIFSEIARSSEVLSEQGAGNQTLPQLVVVTGAAGGTGKTTVAMGIASELSRLSRRTLFFCAEQMQSFRFLLKEQEPLSPECVRQITDGGNYPVAAIDACLREEYCRYLPPVPTEILCSEQSRKFLLKCIRTAVSSGEYDFIIVDTDPAYDGFGQELVRDADRVIVVFNEDRKRILAGEFVRMCENQSRIIAACNRMKPGNLPGCLIPEQECSGIEELADYASAADSWFIGSSGIQKLVQRFA